MSASRAPRDPAPLEDGAECEPLAPAPPSPSRSRPLLGRRVAQVLMLLVALVIVLCVLCGDHSRLPKSWVNGILVAAKDRSSPHPKYERVDGDIETLWQRPPGQPKGIFFIAHGCNHQGTDVFDEVDSDGWVFEACRTKSYFGRCLGLPEETHLRRVALARGYVVVAVSGGAGKKSCWLGRDVPRVIKAIDHVRTVEGLASDAAVFASGASSGGSFMGFLALPGQLPNLKCIVPQVSDVHTLTYGDASRKIPTLLVQMVKDGNTRDGVDDDMIFLKEKGVRRAKIDVQARKVTADFLEVCLSPDPAQRAVDALKQHGLLDEKGYLKENPRKGAWVEAIRRVIKGQSDDTLVPDESCISERMNVAWAFHEFTGQFAEDMLDFCEAQGRFGDQAAVAKL